MRVLIAGGGTGGHLFPGIAVARALIAIRPEAQVSFVGTARGIEARVLPREGFRLDLIRSGGLKGKSIRARLRGAALLPLSFADTWRILSARRPQLVIGVGGYSSGPVVLTAALRGIPTMVLEQNAVPGLTNRLLRPFVRAAAVTFESTREFFGSKAFVSGNPIRAEFLATVERTVDREARETAAIVRVLVVGGSQGAHAINVAMVEAAPELAGSSHLHLTHQTGEQDLEMVRTAYRRVGLQADVEAFFYDIATRIGEADLIVCRAGATTLAEISAAGKAAILIPLPTAADDHQRKNADAMAEKGAAAVLLQSAMSGSVLANQILSLAADRDRRARMAKAARAAAKTDAAEIIVKRALELVEARS